MRLLRAALVALFVVGNSQVLMAAPPSFADRRQDRDRIDPLQSEDSISSDVNRTKRNKQTTNNNSRQRQQQQQQDDMLAANLVLNSLDIAKLQQQQQRQIEQQLPKRITGSRLSSSGRSPYSSVTAKPSKQARRRQATDEDDEKFDENAPFGEDGKVTLQIPGKLFGNATNLFLNMARIFGDFITNTAVRSARFLQLFQPLFGRNLYIQIPTTTTESNEV